MNGSVEFEEMGGVQWSRSTPLVYCPAVGTERFSSTMLGTMSGGQVGMVVGGEPASKAPQCVWRGYAHADSGQVVA